MRKIVLLCIGFCFLFAVGCGKSEREENIQESLATGHETENSENTEIDIPEAIDTESASELGTELVLEIGVPEEELSLMQKVLLNRAEFNEGKKIEQIEELCDYESNYAFFAVVDLDGDGNAEVCVNYPPGEVLILHESDGMIYGYFKSYRGFNPVYKDGTFGGSNGASENFFMGNVTFEHNQFEYDIILAWKDDLNESKIYKNSYWGSENPIEITGEECKKILENYSREKVEEYDFTIENILKFVR